MIEQGRRLIESLAPQFFTAKSRATLGASIGGHLRHNLDHYACFLRGIDCGRVDYDERERAEGIETQPAVAVAALVRAAEGLGGVAEAVFDRDLLVRMDTGDTDERPWTRSTGRRELQFLLSHTVHHYALIAMICRMHDQPIEQDFGVAPSTIKHRRRAVAAPAACAR
ncbi:MAG TPA: hypothetical protein VGA56_01630 [Opitutaceae bacterium]